MKKWVVGLLLVAGLLAMTGCIGTRLQIYNESSVYLDDVSWLTTYFGEMDPGDSVTKTVTAGTDSVYVMIDGSWYYTLEEITVNEGEKEIYSLYDDTLVYGPLGLGREKATGKAMRLGDIR